MAINNYRDFHQNNFGEEITTYVTMQQGLLEENKKIHY